MATDVILAIDQGTTNTKAILVDRTGVPVFRTSMPVTVLFPQPGFVEQDPLALWQSVLGVVAACLVFAGDHNLRVEGIAISNQRETAVAWRPGSHPEPASNAISWQCRRSSEICNCLRDSHSLIRSISGLPVDPLATAGKWSWLLEHNPSLRADADRGDLLFGTVDAWLLANLTSGRSHVTDHSNASRTGVFSLHDTGWNDELLSLFGLPRTALPTVQASASQFGLCSGIPELAGVPIVAMIGDSHAALIGHGSLAPGAVKATYGTGSSLMMLTRSLLEEAGSLARTIAWSDSEGIRFALEGNIAMTGSAVQWVGEFLGLEHPVVDTVALSDSVPDAAGLCFVPAMVGLGAPYWDTHAMGLISNLGRSHKAGHLARAALDAIAFQVADVLYCMERESGAPISSLRVDGGPTRNDKLMQFQANLIRRPIRRSTNEELSALGAGWLGGLTCGWWSSVSDFEALPHPDTLFSPDLSAKESSTLYGEWQMAVARARLVEEETML